MTVDVVSTDLVVLFPAMEAEAVKASEATKVSEAMMETEAVKALEATTESNVDLASPAAASMIRTVEIPSTVPIINLEARMPAINVTGPEEASIRIETNHSIAPDVHLIRLKVVTDHVSMALPFQKQIVLTEDRADPEFRNPVQALITENPMGCILLPIIPYFLIRMQPCA